MELGRAITRLRKILTELSDEDRELAMLTTITPQVKQSIIREYERQRRTLSRTLSGKVSGTQHRDNVPDSKQLVPPLPPLTKTSASSLSVVLEPKDQQFLESCPEPFRSQWLGDTSWWDGLLNGYPKVDLQEEANRYIAHQRSVGKNGHKNLRRGFRNWIAIAEAKRQKQAMWDAQKTSGR